MLENSKPIQGVDLAEIFMQMLQEIPWNTLKQYIQANSQLHKLCTIGGHRLDPKQKTRVCKMLLKEAEKAEFTAGICNGFFAQWYPVHSDLHERLENYFHSDEYKAYRQEHDLDEDTYVLPDAKFEEFFNVSELPAWRVLLCFSPLAFTDAQAEKILAKAGDNGDLLGRISELEAEASKLQAELAQRSNEATQVREQYEKISGEWQNLRRERRDLTSGAEALQTKFEQSQNENRKLRDQLTQTTQERDQQKQLSAEMIERKTADLQSTMRQLRSEAEDWREKYEQQRGIWRDQDRTIKQLKTQLDEQHKLVAARNQDIAALRHFADLVLQSMDWPKIGQMLKPTAAVKRQFNSLVKKLNYEQDRSLTIGDTLVEFWDKLQKRERELIDSIAQSEILEVQSGDIEQYWNSLTDLFEDVAIGLEARTMLLRMLREIFYQSFDAEALENATLPESVFQNIK